MSLLVLKGVSKRYGKVTALADIDLAVAAGSRTAIIGPSGSGKTTLLRIIVGFEAPDEGRVTLGPDLLADGSAAMPAHLRGVGIVAQDGALFPHLSVAENIGFGLESRDPGRAARIGDLMAMVDLDASLGKRRPDELSGGQQQRVALARALARRPRLMLLDEPFSALDTGLRAGTRRAVADLLANAGIATILVTHDQAEALSFADQVAVLRDGRLAQVGAPRDLYLRPRDPGVARFLGDAIVLPAQVADGWADCALGRIGIDDRGRRGTADILLRPEQLSLAKAAGMVTEPGCGRVAEIEFGGAVCLVTVELASARDMPARLLTLRTSGIEAPPVGAAVRLVVTGTAHAFDKLA